MITSEKSPATLMRPRPEATSELAVPEIEFSCESYSTEEETLRKILVVDDNREFVVAIAAVLEDAGYVVQTAFDVGSAVDAILREDPDLLLLDVRLGGERGFDIREELYKRGEVFTRPTIYITGDQSEWISRLSEAVGGKALVHKPFRRSDLLKAIEDNLPI